MTSTKDYNCIIFWPTSFEPTEKNEKMLSIINQTCAGSKLFFGITVEDRIIFSFVSKIVKHVLRYISNSSQQELVRYHIGCYLCVTCLLFVSGQLRSSLNTLQWRKGSISSCLCTTGCLFSIIIYQFDFQCES